MSDRLDQEKRLRDLIADIQREPKHVKKRAFKDALQILTSDTYRGTIDKLVHDSIKHVGIFFVYGAVTAMSDSYIRNEVLANFLYEWLYDVSNFTTWYFQNGAMRAILKSDFATPEQLEHIVWFNPKFSKEIAKRAIIFAAEEKPGSISLIMKLVQHGRLKKKQRIKLASFILGMDSATMHDLMRIVSDFPELRRDAAAIALTRSTITPKDIQDLICYEETKEMVAIMRPDLK